MKRKMKNVVVMILSIALAGAVLTGCGESQKPVQEAQQDVTNALEREEQDITDASQEDESESEVEEETVQKSEGYEDNFAVDSDAAREFAVKVQDAAAQKDLEALAELTAFPVYVGLPGVDVVETKEDFLSIGADILFTDELLESVETADIENFQPSMAGFSISGGGKANINFGVVDGVLAINGINY